MRRLGSWGAGDAGTAAASELPLPQLTEGPTGPLELEIYGPTRELYRIAVPPLRLDLTDAPFMTRLCGLFP